MLIYWKGWTDKICWQIKCNVWERGVKAFCLSVPESLEKLVLREWSNHSVSYNIIKWNKLWNKLFPSYFSLSILIINSIHIRFGPPFGRISLALNPCSFVWVGFFQVSNVLWEMDTSRVLLLEIFTLWVVRRLSAVLSQSPLSSSWVLIGAVELKRSLTLSLSTDLRQMRVWLTLFFLQVSREWMTVGGTLFKGPRIVGYWTPQNFWKSLRWVWHLRTTSNSLRNMTLKITSHIK